MISRSAKWLVLAVALLTLVFTPMTLAQGPSAVSIFSIWVRLSLRGFNQEEIESLLQNMDSKLVEQVKTRLRKTVLGNLQLKKIGDLIKRSQDKDDINIVISSIETEIRFAGMQNDEPLKLLIKDQFGINIARF